MMGNEIVMLADMFDVSTLRFRNDFQINRSGLNFNNV